MVTDLTVKLYMMKLPNTDGFFALDKLEQDEAIFGAFELLKDNFPVEKLTDRVVALQVLYMLEGEGEEFAMLKRQGVKSYSVKGISVTFDGSGISPDVIGILVGTPRAAIGRLI